MEVKDLNKCKTGHAFEVILKQPTVSGDGSAAPSPLKVLLPSKKRDVSLDDIRGKLMAAEERRKVEPYIRGFHYEVLHLLLKKFFLLLYSKY